MYHGDIRLGDTFDLKFTSRAFATGAPTQLAGSPVVSAYPGNSTSQLTAGITLSVDLDSVTGLNNVRVAATSGNGYATATDYALVITTGTVGGVSVVGEVIGHFSIEKRSALMPATAGRTLVVDAAGLADANAVKVGPTGSGTAQTAGDIMADTNDIQTRLPAALVGGRMDSSVGAMANNVLTAAAINADAITDAKVASDVTIASVTGAVGSVTGNVGGNVTGSVGSVSGLTASDVGAIKTKTDNLPSDPADQSLVIAATDAVMTRLGAPGGASVSADVAAIKSDTGAVKTKTDQLVFSTANRVNAQLFGIEDDAVTAASIATGAIGALELEPGAAAEIAAAVWDEATSGHATAGSTGKALTDAGSAGTPLDAAGVRSAIGMASANLDTQLAAVQSDTDNIQTRIPAALVSGRMDASVGAVAAGAIDAGAIAADAIGSSELAASAASEIATAVRTELATELGRVDAAISTRLASVGYTAPDNASVTAIKAKTDNLPSDPADESLIIAAADAIMTRLGAPAGASMSADIALKTGYRLSAAGVDDILRTALTEAYASNGAAPTLSQLLFMVWSMLGNKDIVDTTLTARKLDGATQAMAFTLDDASAPTSQARAA